MSKLKKWEIKDTSGSFSLVTADQVITDSENKIINFYAEGELIAKYPITHIIRMGVLDEKLKEEANNEITG